MHAKFCHSFGSLDTNLQKLWQNYSHVVKLINLHQDNKKHTKILFNREAETFKANIYLKNHLQYIEI